MPRLIYRVAIIMMILYVTAPAMAEENEDGLLYQVLLATMQLEEKDSDIKGDDYDLSFLGFAVQKPFTKSALSYGLETGALLSSENDTRLVRFSSGSSGSSATVVIENEMLLLDYFFGGYASLEMADRLRFYVGAGPSIIYGRRDITAESDDEDNLVDEGSESEIGIGVYARGGLEIRISDNTIFGGGLRAMTSNIEFNDSEGEIKIEGIQYYLNITINI